MCAWIYVSDITHNTDPDNRDIDPNLTTNLTRKWFQTIFIIESSLNFGTKGQSKLKLLLGLLILDN